MRQPADMAVEKAIWNFGEGIGTKIAY